MLRTRLLWFASGFSTTVAAFTFFVYKDLWFDRRTLSSELTHKFGALEGRLSNLEETLRSNSNSLQDEGNLN